MRTVTEDGSDVSVTAPMTCRTATDRGCRKLSLGSQTDHGERNIEGTAVCVCSDQARSSRCLAPLGRLWAGQPGSQAARFGRRPQRDEHPAELTMAIRDFLSQHEFQTAPTRARQSLLRGPGLDR